MISPYQLIGMSYRLGADPERHGKADCLSLASAVVRYQGFEVPAPRREWYRRLRRGDYGVFREEIERWGDKIAEPRIGSVALCQTDTGGIGLAAYWEAGWISFNGLEVSWSPIAALPVVGCYYPQKSSCAKPLD